MSDETSFGRQTSRSLVTGVAFLSAIALFQLLDSKLRSAIGLFEIALSKKRHLCYHPSTVTANLLRFTSTSTDALRPIVLDLSGVPADPASDQQFPFHAAASPCAVEIGKFANPTPRIVGELLHEIEGQEVTRQVRTAILEVPEDMTDEEVECVNADHFNHVEERTPWEVEGTDGIYAEGFPTFVGLADDDAEPEVIVYRDDNGEFRVRGSDGC